MENYALAYIIIYIYRPVIIPNNIRLQEKTARMAFFAIGLILTFKKYTIKSVSNFFLVIRFLLSFPHFLSVQASILHIKKQMHLKCMHTLFANLQKCVEKYILSNKVYSCFLGTVFHF